MTISDKIEQVVTDLGDARDDITAVLDDIWLEIDHTNQNSIKSGSERMIAVLDAATSFRKAVDELTARLRGFLPANTSAVAIAIEPTVAVQRPNPMALLEQVSLHAPWTYRRPAGFSLREKHFPYQNTWSGLYLRLLKVLHESNPGIFDSLPDRPAFTSNHNKPYLTRDKTRLREASKVGEVVFVETNLNANLIRDNIRYVLKTFEIPETEIQIFLRK